MGSITIRSTSARPFSTSAESINVENMYLIKTLCLSTLAGSNYAHLDRRAEIQSAVLKDVEAVKLSVGGNLAGSDLTVGSSMPAVAPLPS